MPQLRGPEELKVDLSCAQWRKSSYSGTNGCIELAIPADDCAVRQFKCPNGGALVFTGHEQRSSVARADLGDFGDPQPRKVQ